MPKNINIQEGGDPKYMNEVRYIQTNLQGSGTCLWVPVDDVKLGTKTITKNGSYSASKSGFYGFEKVIVNVPGGDSNKTNNGKLADEDGNEAKDENGNSITPAPSGGSGSSVSGTDPDDGNDYKVDVDENGNLKKTKLPSRIAVTRNPDKVQYTSGETLNPSGIIVHAYFGDNTDYGTVLNNELTYNPMEITIDSESGSSSEYTDGHGINAMAITFRTITGRIHEGGVYYHDFTQHIANRPTGYSNNRNKDFYMGLIYTDTVVGAVVYLTQYNGDVYMCRNSSTSTDRYSGYADYEQTDMYGTHYYDEIMTTSDTINLGTFARSYNMSDEKGMYVPESTVDPTGIHYNTLHPAETPITVQWNRPADGKKLTTTFNVTVLPAENTEDDNNSGGGGSHGF